MNPVTEALPPLPPQPHRPSTSCDRHPQERFTGFCPSCLCERLAVLEPSSTSTSSRKPPLNSSAAAAALKAIFRPSAGAGLPSAASGRNKPSSFFPELRRTKSFSASKNEGFSGVFEPQRKSCDVRGRNTLCTLFTQDDERNPLKNEAPPVSNGGVHIEDEPRNLASPSEDEQDETETEPEIEISVECNAGNVVDDRVQEIVEEDEEEEQGEEEDHEEPSRAETELVQDDFKSIKDHIDLDSQPKKPSGRDFKEIAGSFWSAASVFSKKWQKWRDKQKLKKQRNGGSSVALPVEKPIGRQFRETQSEIADYGYGRRSCDTDPRFSLDAGRISFDDPRYSFEEPRASWDGYLVSRTFTRMPTMLSVVEDAPIHVSRTDTQIPVEEPAIPGNDDETVPGGSEQTRDYYSDSSRRRRSLDRSSSLRKTAAAVVADMDEVKSSSNAKVSPATADFFSGPKLVVPDKIQRDSNSNSLRDDCSETFEIPFRNGERKEAKKSRRWGKGWNILAFIHRRNGNKYEDDDRYSSRTNGVTRSLSESWPEFRGDRNCDVRAIGGIGGTGFNPKMMRSNSSVSWRSSQSNNNGGSFGSSMRKSNNGGLWRTKKEDLVLERNPSARYSPNEVVDNGLLRFYLTPMKGGGSRRGGIVKNRPNPAQSIARSVLRLY
ncbi:UPF0503 protein, chloroplastic, partial [Cucurbita argyrosperma subsp. argyrosperma]